MIVYVHYRETDGEIFGWETATAIEPPPSSFGGFSYSGFLTFTPDPKTQKIIDKKIVDKTPDEIETSRQPTVFDIKAAVFSELSNTDVFMLADRITSEQEMWVSYRQALRDISKMSVASEMLAIWPARPDGMNAIAGRQRSINV